MAKLEEIEGVPDFAQPKASPISVVKLQEIDGTPPGLATTKRQVSFGERAMAVPAGINRGFWADLPGIPVDAVANVIDLGKAAIGATAGGIGKLVGADPRTIEKYMPDITPRGQVVGSGEWIANQLNKGSQAVTGTRAFDNPNPEDTASRILFAGGRAAGGSVVPNPRAAISAGQQAMNLGMGGAGGLLASGVAEALPNGGLGMDQSQLSMLASFLPQVAKSGAQAATQRIIRGNEQGRQAMEQRIQDLKNAGIENPSAGLASGNPTIMGLENILSQTPGSVGAFQKSKDQLLSGIQNRVNDIRGQISPVYGPVEAGTSIQKSLTGPFKERIGNTYGALNDRVSAAVGPEMPIPITQTAQTAKGLITPIPGAEATSTNFINPRIQKIYSDLMADTKATPAKVTSGAIIGPNGQPILQTYTPATTPQGIPFQAVKDLRTKIGKETQSNAIMGTPEQADFKQLYGGMSQDMKNGVTLADIQNGINPAAGGSATTALNRANSFYSNAMNRAEDLSALANKSTPEGAYKTVAQSLESGPTIWNKLRGPLTPEARKQVVATVVDEMGKAPAGQQGADTSTWSPSTFLTNFNRVAKTDPGAIDNLFKRLPGGEQHAQNLQEVAKAAEMLKDASKVWANPSGTSQALSAKGTFGAIGLGLTGGLFYTPLLAAGAGAAGGLAGSAGMSRLLLNPQFVSWLAKAPNVKPQDQQAYALRMLANSRFSPDKQYQEDVKNYLSEVADSANQ